MRHLGVAQPTNAAAFARTFEKEHTMNAVTYGGARASRGAVSQRIEAKKARPLLARFLDALKESRRQQAHRVIVDFAQLEITVIRPTTEND
jgi:hypothetical protein